VARKQFTIRTEPHVAEVAGVELTFVPEVYGDEFLDAYTALQEAQKAAGVDLTDLANVDADKIRDVTRSLRTFLNQFKTPDSPPLLVRYDVVKGAKTLESYESRDEADKHAAKTAGATVVDASLRLPDRVLVELLEWVVGLYGGDEEERPPTSSTDSSSASPPRGPRGKVSSRSRG